MNCSLCKSVVRERYDNLYTYEWNIDGSGVKVPSNTRIEVNELGDVGELNSLNF